MRSRSSADGDPRDDDATETGAPVLVIRDLVVDFPTADGLIGAVRGVDLDVYPGEMLAIVGETGSGKTTTMLAALGLVSSSAQVRGRVQYRGHDLLQMSPRERRRIRGVEISMIFQDPLTALNPVLTVGWQAAEALRVHDRHMSKAEARRRVVDLFTRLGLSEPELRFDQYPHQLSGGMCQRVAIAMAIANNPTIIVADEPTTALDVTIQAQILDILRQAQRETRAATVLITHDLGVVAEVADRICVMYGGRVVEAGPVASVLREPRHPYTAALLDSIPSPEHEVEFLRTIPGQPPDLREQITGCSFVPRCRLSAGRAICRDVRPELMSTPNNGDRYAACHFSAELSVANHAGTIR